MDKENYEILWEKVFLPEIESLVSSIAFESFIKLLNPVDIKGNTIILATQSKLFADGVSNKMIGSKIKEAILKANTHITDYVVVVAKDREEYLKQLGDEQKEELETQGSPINPKFTFD